MVELTRSVVVENHARFIVNLLGDKEELKPRNFFDGVGPAVKARRRGYVVLVNGAAGRCDE